MFPLFPLFLIFFICILAETNRHPFDLPEAEAELVSGYNVEYSAMGFALFFLAEYGNIILMSTLITLLFLGGWVSPLFIGFLLPGNV
jgi:NADH-quinone oxidoreductase subunit H